MKRQVRQQIEQWTNGTDVQGEFLLREDQEPQNGRIAKLARNVSHLDLTSDLRRNLGSPQRTRACSLGCPKKMRL